MSDDAALEFFLKDAAAQGITLAEYERKYGLILEMRLPPPALHRIQRNEVSGGLMSDGDYRLAQHKEKRRAKARRLQRVEIRQESEDEAAA